MRSTFLFIVILIFTMAMIMLNQTWAQLWLIYSRPELPWQAWRFLTASFCHTNSYHFAINSAGLIVIWQLFKPHLPWLRLSTLIIIISSLVGLSLWLFNPDVIWYVGLSGTLHGLFSYGVCKDIAQKVSLAWPLLFGLIGKLAFEQFGSEPTMMANLIEANVMVDAHLYGAIIGLCCYLIGFFTFQFKHKKSKH
ncbi:MULTISPECIES: rhombosortase [unclassified Motilimonas]|uniref:rhombosortase n=1 Tax=Motilimonas TaxID=1914248 RepID=UPI001E2C8AB6|nr:MULTISPECIES: rhombosortase [unclassified Motilimonas]MCE0558311.1 rhombosortase [Motilimonas sp. E26]MDO6524675.1 rhombosortase [Motilimonas sp. 1_MG-2023]